MLDLLIMGFGFWVNAWIGACFELLKILRY